MKRFFYYIYNKIRHRSSVLHFGAFVSNSEICNSILYHNASVKNSTLRNNVSIGPNVKVENCTLEEHVKIHFNSRLYHSTIGKLTYITNNASIGHTSIGAFCSIGDNFFCVGTNHPLNRMSTHPTFYSTRNQSGKSFTNMSSFDEFKPITIGNDVWIGAHVLILGGVKVGDGAIIGAGSVVTKDVPPYAIYAGNPSKLIRYRFSTEKIKELLALKWWNWSDDKIIQNIDLFS